MRPCVVGKTCLTNILLESLQNNKTSKNDMSYAKSFFDGYNTFYIPYTTTIFLGFESYLHRDRTKVLKELEEFMNEQKISIFLHRKYEGMLLAHDINVFMLYDDLPPGVPEKDPKPNCNIM